MLTERSFVLLLAVVAAGVIFSFGCSGGGGGTQEHPEIPIPGPGTEPPPVVPPGPGTGPPPVAPPAVPPAVPPTVPAELVKDLPPPVELVQYSDEEKQIVTQNLDEMPLNLLTSTDLIVKDFLSGTISELDMQKQKICLYLGNECLLPQYRYQEGMALAKSGTRLASEVRSYVYQSPELLNFFNSLMPTVAPASGVGESVNVTTKTLGGGPRPTIYAAGEGVQLDYSDPYKSDIALLDKKSSFDVGGQGFDLFYHSLVRDVAVGVEDAIKNSYDKLKNELFGGKHVIPYGDSEIHKGRYRLYVLPATSNNEGFLGVTYNFRNGTSYIHIYADNVKDSSVQFKRVTKNVDRAAMIYGVGVHELTHALENTFLKGIGQDRLDEALASFATEYIYPQDSSAKPPLPGFLYEQDVPVWSGVPDVHLYGAYILFEFARYRVGGVSTIADYLKKLAEGKSFNEAFPFLVSTGGQDYKGALHQFALANLNLTPVPNGVVDYKQYDRYYDKKFLSGISGYNMTMLPDTYSMTELTSSKFKVKNLMPGSVQYFTLMSMAGKGLFRKFEIGAQSIMSQGVLGTVFYFRIPEGREEDVYDILGRDEITGTLNRCFTSQNGEPDVIVVVLSNTNLSGGALNGEIRVKGEPFCEKAGMRATRTEKMTEDGKVVKSVTLTGFIQYKPEDVLLSVSNSQSTLHDYRFFGPKPDLQNNSMAIAPYVLEGSYDWSISGTVTRGEKCKVTSTYKGGERGPLPAGKMIFLMGRDAIEEKADKSPAEQLYRLYFNGVPDESPFTIHYSVESSCGGTDCPVPCGGTDEFEEEGFMPIIEGFYANGQSTLTNSATVADADDISRWEIVFPEPIGIRKFSQDFNLRLIYTDGNLIGVMKPPIVDN